MMMKLCETRERLKTAVERGEIRKGDLGRRPQEPRVFVIHAGEDKESFARPLVTNLLQQGLAEKDIFFDDVSINPGDVIGNKILSTLANPTLELAVIVVSTSFLNKSYWPKLEYETCLKNKKKIFPIWVDANNENFKAFSEQVGKYSPTLKQLSARRVQKEDVIDELPNIAAEVIQRLSALERDSPESTEATRWTTNRMVAFGILLTVLVTCSLMYMVQYGFKAHEPTSLAVFPRRLKTFVGREDVLSKIDTCLQENQTCLIKGLGGVGKTSVAIEYGHRRAERYPGGVFWVRLASKGDMCASISQYSTYFSNSLQLNNDMSCKATKMHLKRYMTNSQVWLLVVDEVVRETMKELESLLPHTLKTTMHVLLTSNEYQRLDNERIPAVRLPPFSDTEAQAMFDKAVRPGSVKNRKEINSLSRSLGHHPLALQLAYAYIEETRCTVKEYHDKYTGGNAMEKVDLLNEADVEKGIDTSLAISSAYVSQLSYNAVNLLNMTSFMGPDCIPCPKPNRKAFQILFNTSDKLDKLDVKKMVSVLEKFSLASPCHTFQPCTFSVNRIVQDVVVARMNESLRIAHLENALKYLTSFLRHSNDTSRVQAEVLMSHVHYLAINVDRYQTEVSVTRSSTFFNKSAEFFCRWGACEEAYFLLLGQILLLSKHDSGQSLSYHIRDHVNFINNILLPCLYKGDEPIDLLIQIADNLFLIAEMLTDTQGHMHCSSNTTYSYFFREILASLKNTTDSIYWRLLNGRKWNIDYSDIPLSFLGSFMTYIHETSLKDLDSLFIPNPAPKTLQAQYWSGMFHLLFSATSLLIPQRQHFFIDSRSIANIDFKKLLYPVQQCNNVMCDYQMEDMVVSCRCFSQANRMYGLQFEKAKCTHETDDVRSQYCYNSVMTASLSLSKQCKDIMCIRDTKLTHCYCLTDVMRESLRHYRSIIQKLVKLAGKALFMYYRSMDTSTCSNRYYEVMLGLPRESKEFDILEFARDTWSDLLGDPGVVKSVMSLTNPQNPKFRNMRVSQNSNHGHILPLEYQKVHQAISWDNLAYTVRKATGQNTAHRSDHIQSPPLLLEKCAAISDAILLIEKNYVYKSSTWKQLHIRLREIKQRLTECYRLHDLYVLLTNQIKILNRWIRAWSEKVKLVDATVFQGRKILSWLDTSNSHPFMEKTVNRFLVLLDQQALLSVKTDKTVKKVKTVSFDKSKFHLCRHIRFHIRYPPLRMPGPFPIYRSSMKSIVKELKRIRHIYDMVLLDYKELRNKKEIIRSIYHQAMSDVFSCIIANHLDSGKTGNPFVYFESLVPNPHIGAFLIRESSFQRTLWLWNWLQELLKYVDCSLHHATLNMTCYTYFIDRLDWYFNKVNCSAYTSNPKGDMFFGQPLSEGRGNFRFVQREDKVIGVAHTVSKLLLQIYNIGFEQAIRTSRKQKRHRDLNVHV